jgi:HK97 family phage portal protein
MATLVTYGDRLLTSAGRESWLARPSVPFAQFGRGSVPLAGGGGLLSFLSVYESQTWVAAAVNKLNRGIMDLPLRLYREVTDDGEVAPVYRHPVMDAILKPWERGSASQLKQKMSFPALIHGNSVLGKVRPEPNAAPTGFVPLDWRFLTAWTLDDGEVYFWETTQPNRQQFWAPEDVIHFAFEAGNGDMGVSPLKQLTRTIGTEDAAQRYQASSFTSGVRPSGALTTDQDLNDTQIDRISAKVRMAHEGPDRQNGMMF